MKRLALLIALAACAPASDDSGDAAATDSMSMPPAPVAGGEPQDTTLKGTTATPAGTANASAAQSGVRGTVRVTGTAMEPTTTIQAPSGPVIVRGAFEPDVRALDGAIVIVTGKQSAGPPRTIEVDSYAIAEIDGQPAVIGIVTTDGRAVVVGNDTLSLVTPPAGLQPGARVWVAGPRMGKQLRVVSWGVIRPAR